MTVSDLRIKMRTTNQLIFLRTQSVTTNFAASNQISDCMKRFILLVLISLMTYGASAEIRYKSIDNMRATNVVLVDNDAPRSVEITDAVLYNDGKEYPAKQIRCNVVNGVANYKLKFKRLTVFKDCKVALTVNGETKTIDIQKAMSDR